MSRTQHKATVERDVPVRMRDGVTLYADVYRPSATGAFPVLLVRTPYDKALAAATAYAHPSWYASQGYIVVMQDCRGRGRSEGDWEPFMNEENDGHDTVKWAAALSGSLPRVGMYGGSYVGATQLQAAIAGPSALACICPAVTSSGPYRDWTYEGGALHLAFTAVWAMSLGQESARRGGLDDAYRTLATTAGHPVDALSFLPLQDMPVLREAGLTPYWFDWLRHPTYDGYWKALAFGPHYGSIRVPALHIGGWYDIFLAGTIRNYVGIQGGGGEGARGRQRLLIGPWVHHPYSSLTGDLNWGPAAASTIVDDEQLRFYDWVLRGRDGGVGSEPPVRLFVMGENRWRFEDEWPLSRAVPTPFYLHSGGRAASFDGDGTLSAGSPANERPDVYIYNPAGPSVSRGGHSCCSEGSTPMGPYDQRPVERWKDVLCYTSEPLAEALEVTGPVSVTLWAASSAVDTDWVARLVDVHPDGTAINLTEGIIRASLRDGLEERRLLERDRVYKYTIDLRATSNVFLPDHRIRVDIASSSFPHWDRNPNTGQLSSETRPWDLVPAQQTVFHDGERPSHIVLPVVSR